jgi:type IV pilus assembly protein PilV
VRFLNVGMGLVEALVAMLVLSIGMLGVAQLFVHSLRSSRSALLRTQAVNLVSDMAGRIRANAGARTAYDFARYAGAPAEHGCAPNAMAGSGSNCSGPQLAEDDLARWQSAVQLALPAAPAGTSAADVQYLAGAPEHYRITVAWQEPGEWRAFSHRAEIFTQVVP